TIPTIVRVRNVVTTSRLDQVVVSVAAVTRRRVGRADELAAVDVDDDVAERGALSSGIGRRQDAVGVELVDVLERRQQRGSLGLGAGRLWGLDEQARRRPA